MNSIFHKLLDNTLAEILRREPAYLSLFPMNFSHTAEKAFAYRQHPLYDQFPSETIEKALLEGSAYIARSWAKSEQVCTDDDPVAHFLCASIVDTFCAAQGLLALQPRCDFKGSISEVFAQEYSERQAPGGSGYYIRNRGKDPLMVINATGTPIAIWRNFLADSTHDFKIIVPQRRGSDLFRGGLQQYVDIRTESADLASILDSESIEEAAVVAWCNGARVAIDLASRRPRQISALVLLGPMFKGVQGVTPNLSRFESDLQPLLDAVLKDPALAPLLSKAISQQTKPPAWSRWTKAPTRRARVLFGLPAKDYACDVLVCLTESESLINIARRVASDESYPMSQALADLRTRTMVIMGSHDEIVSNELASSAMRKVRANSVVKAVLFGGGHYIHDLQYHYFRLLLTEFLGNHRTPPATARISVEELRCASL